MIVLNNLNKYFNKGKKNQIHVINNTNLELGDKGLTVFLGQSGCGKTTLLNVIGGLDNVSKGKIYIDGKRITKRSAYYKDKIRTLNIGYIFQDYHLINSMSVFDNVALVLKMIGIKDKDEINKRVNYCLEKTQMYRYKKRLAGMLSGGERQRVAIARALVKNPSIIIADEPTGNLDSRNTLEIMNIIKSISKNKLVILVTHEEDIASFYADRILTIEDGTIKSDKQNITDDLLDYKIDNKIYLKDFKYINNYKNDVVDINTYSDNNEQIKLDIVYKNGNIYIRNLLKDKIEVVDNTNVELVDDHYKKLDKTIYENNSFDFDALINKNTKLKYKSIYNIFSSIKYGFGKVFGYSILKKLLLVGFCTSGMFTLFSISNTYGINQINDSSFIKYNKDYLLVKQNNINVNDYLAYEKLEDIDYILPGDSLVNLTIKYNYLYQTVYSSDNFNTSLTDYLTIDDNDIIYGRNIKNSNEIILDKLVIDKIFSNNNAKQVGILSITDMLDKKVSIPNMKDFIIVGITDKKSPCVYTMKDNFINIIASTGEIIDYDMMTKDSTKHVNNDLIDYTLLQDKITLKKGNYPSNDYEALVNISNENVYKIGKYLDITVNGQKLKVVGYYHSKENIQKILVNNNTIKYDLINNKNSFTIYSKDKNKTINYFQTKKLNIEKTYEVSREKYIDSRKENVKITLIIALIILSISLIEIILMIRSSFLSRIKEVGILRAIGVKKLDIYKMFWGEVFAITTIASVPGLLFMAYIIKNLITIKYFTEQFMLNGLIIGLSIIFIYVFNSFFGLLPVANTMRKTPAHILSRVDAD